jgi:hypothetical protein
MNADGVDECSGVEVDVVVVVLPEEKEHPPIGLVLDMHVDATLFPTADISNDRDDVFNLIGYSFGIC